ncbi:phosphatase PAP2 family protein [Halalkalibacterium ligniniphilum]|uniref:phosphatase PAP2 family protein n=1 Tax=Halalkalibacterium ligniniphilum TaxID=1134413 RepID=UPI000347076F|nr:phosphatase PAP2 family protein [Halalkalibacterium ligniniphilum]
MPQKNNNIYIMISSFFLFLIISILSMRNKLTLLDQSIISSLTDGTSTIVMTLMELVTKIGSGEMILIATLIISIFLMVKKMRKHVILLFLLTFGGIVLNFALKILFQRERPGEMSVIEVFGYSLEIASYSFPSGHTMRSVLLFSFLIYMSYHFIKKPFARVAVIGLLSFMILLIALSRIIVGAHFPTDILAAVSISIAWFYSCLILLQYLLKISSRITFSVK